MKNPALSVLFLDDHLVVIDKPAGLLTIPDRYAKEEANLRDLASEQFGTVRVVHRIDKETSGVVLLARNEEAHKIMNTQFEERSVEKRYRALCHGTPEEDDFTIDRPLRVDGDRLHRTLVDAYNGKESVTHVRVIEKFRHFVWFECMPETGRTHQIRVHLAEQGLPIVCDELYGSGEPLFLSALKSTFKLAEDTEERPMLSRLALHAFSLQITHPVAGMRLTFEAPVPKDLKAAVNQLGKHAKFRGVRF